MKRVVWDEPWPGYDVDGPCTVILHCSMSPEDAIKVSRKQYTREYPEDPWPSPEKLLNEFVVIHWASIEEVPDATIN